VLEAVGLLDIRLGAQTPICVSCSAEGHWIGLRQWWSLIGHGHCVSRARGSGDPSAARWVGMIEWFGLLAERASEGLGGFPEAAGDVVVV
jgi:hypothetical protein